MATDVSKSADMRYALDLEFWKDVIDLNLMAQVFGKKGFEHFLKLSGEHTPTTANRELVRCIDDVLRAHAAPQQKVGAFQMVVSFDKTFSVWLAVQTPQKQKEVVDKVTKMAADVCGGMCEQQFRRFGASGANRETSHGFGFGVPQLTCSRGTPYFHLHIYFPNLTLSAPDRFGAIGNATARIYDLSDVALAKIQKGVNDLLISYGVATELAPDGKHVRVSGFPKAAIDELSLGKKEIQRIMDEAAAKGQPVAVRWAALYAHSEAKRQGTPAYTVAERAVATRLVLEKHGMDVSKVILPDVPRPGAGAKDLTPEESRKAQFMAFDVVTEAKKQVAIEHGFFSARQLRAAAYRGGIGKTVNGKPLPTAEVVRNVNQLLKSEAVERRIFGDPEKGLLVRFAARETAETLKRSFLDRAFEATAKVVGQGKEAVTSTVFTLKETAAKAGSFVLGGVRYAADKVVTPKLPPPEIRLTAAQVPNFVRQRTRMSKRRAIWKAYWEGRARPGRSVADKIGNMRWAYHRLRQAPRMEKGTKVIVVDGNNLTDAKVHHALKKLCQRDKAELSLEGRESAMPKSEPSKKQAEKKQSEKKQDHSKQKAPPPPPPPPPPKHEYRP